MTGWLGKRLYQWAFASGKREHFWARLLGALILAAALYYWRIIWPTYLLLGALIGAMAMSWVFYYLNHRLERALHNAAHGRG